MAWGKFACGKVCEVPGLPKAFDNINVLKVLWSSQNLSFKKGSEPPEAAPVISP